MTRVRVLAAFTLALATATGCGAKRASSRTDVTRYHALARAAVGPLDAPAWTGAISAANAAFVAELPGGAVLVAYSTMERVGNNLSARRAAVTRLALHDLRTGAARWDVGTSFFGQVTLASTQPTLVLLHEGGLTALDPSTGRLAWERKTAARAVAPDPAHGQVVVWSGGGAPDQAVLVAVDVATGKDRWTRALPADVAAVMPQLTVSGDRLVAVGLRAAVVRADTGALVAAPPVELGAPASVAEVGDGLVLADVRGRVVRLGADGAVAWVAETGARSTYLLASGDRLLAATAKDLHLLSLGTGREVWRVDGEHTGPAAIVGDRVLWSIRPRLVFLDVATGKETAAAPRSPGMQLGGLPDRLLFDDDQVTVVGETGVMAVALGGKRPAGAVLWRLDLRGVWSARTAFLRWSGGALDAAPASYHATAGLTLPPIVLAPPPKLDNPYAAKLDSEGSRLGSGERVRLLRLAAARAASNHEFEVAHASLGASMAALNSVMTNLSAASQAWTLSATLRQNALAEEPTTLWLASMQGALLVRPIAWELGQGVLVADLRTGRWREIVTGPGEVAMDDFYLAHAPATVEPEATTLVTLGRAGPPVELVEFPNLRTTARTALAYPLGDPRGWAPPEQYPARSRVPPAVTELAPAALKEFVLFPGETIRFDRNRVERIVKGVSTRDDVRRLLGEPGGARKVGSGSTVEIWTYSNARPPSKIEIALFEFDARGVVVRISHPWN